MKIKILTLVLFLCALTQTKAQDIIIKNDKTEIKAKVLELTEDVIKYRKFEVLDGPIYSIKKSDVFMILYKNGIKEYIENNTTPKAQPAAENTPTATQKTNATSTKTPVNFENSFIITKINIKGKEKTVREGFTTHTIDVNSSLTGFPPIFTSVNLAATPDILAGLGFSFYNYSDGYGSSVSSYGIAARGLYSFNNVLKMPISKYNLYGGLSLNYAYSSAIVNILGFGSSTTTVSDVGVGLLVGGRISLVGPIGAVTELGFANGGTSISVGLSISPRRSILKALEANKIK